MGNYYSVRLWQLRAGCSGAELEELVSSGFLEMQRWIPGVKHVSLMRLGGEPTGRYFLTITFASYEAYLYWRQVEEEAPDYWERFASVYIYWEQLSQLVEEYSGEIVMDVALEGHAEGTYTS